jgi:MYXO-CTERM domain-containing protein
MVRCCIVIAALVPTLAAADPVDTTSLPEHHTATVTATAERRIAIETPMSAFAPQAGVSHTIFLERCRGGCRITKGTVNDASTNTSTIPANSGVSTISEYKNAQGQDGAAADEEWNAVLKCVQEVYSPLQVTVTDVRPPAGAGSYHLAVLAGVPSEIGMSNDILGIAPLAANCAAQDNVISFSFANAHQTSERVNNLCWTAAQESAHAFGLDHEFVFKDGRSACSDPMTYRVDCGGQRFFRNASAACGEFTEKPACHCSPTQNSHQKLLSVFGPGTSITPPPTSAITLPATGGGLLGAVVAASAGSQRGISKVELLINGFVWAESTGARFGPTGQPNPATYTLVVPDNLPDSIVDVVVRAREDIGTFTDSAPVTVTKGAPCASADACAAHQKCEAGRCLWDPPVGELGDACSYPQFCKSGLCRGTADSQICTQPCVVEADTCPQDLSCIATNAGEGICFTPGGGCCSVAGGAGAPWIHGGIAALVLGASLRRRRR